MVLMTNGHACAIYIHSMGTIHTHLGHFRLQLPHFLTRWFFYKCLLIACPQLPCPKLCLSLFRKLPGRGLAVNMPFRNPAASFPIFLSNCLPNTSLQLPQTAHILGLLLHKIPIFPSTPAFSGTPLNA